MKKLKNITVVVFILTWFSGAGAMEIRRNGVSLNSDQTLLIELSKVSQGTQISFEDQNERVLYKDNLLVNGNYSKTLDLEIIPTGTYYLKVDEKFSTRIWKILKSSEGIEIWDKKSSVNFKPQFKLREKLLTIFMTNPAKANVDLLLEDEKGVILTEIRDSKDVYIKNLDLRKLPAGEYYVTVATGKEKFKEKVILR